MKTKKIIICGFIVLAIAFMPITSVYAAQPPLPPEMELVVCDSRLDENTMAIVDQIVEDSARCGIRLQVTILSYYDTVMRIFSGDFDLILFIAIGWVFEDPMDTLIQLLWFHFANYSYCNTHDPAITAKIEEMSDYYYLYGDLDSAVNVFHEIERMAYENEPIATMCYHMYGDLIYNHHLLMNNAEGSPLNDYTIRKALSFLIDRELFAETVAVFYEEPVTISSSMFGWSQYHDPTIPEFDLHIGSAASTLAKAGYRPRALH